MANTVMITSLTHSIVVAARVVNEHDEAGDQQDEARGRCVALVATFEALGRELAPLLERGQPQARAAPVEVEPPYVAPDDGDPADSDDDED